MYVKASSGLNVYDVITVQCTTEHHSTASRVEPLDQQQQHMRYVRMNHEIEKRIIVNFEQHSAVKNEKKDIETTPSPSGPGWPRYINQSQRRVSTVRYRYRETGESETKSEEQK